MVTYNSYNGKKTENKNHCYKPSNFIHYINISIFSKITYFYYYFYLG